MNRRSFLKLTGMAALFPFLPKAKAIPRMKGQSADMVIIDEEPDYIEVTEFYDVATKTLFVVGGSVLLTKQQFLQHPYAFTGERFADIDKMEWIAVNKRLATQKRKRYNLEGFNRNHDLFK
jgi:hypothetical protein